MNGFKALAALQQREIAKAAAAGEEFFFELPDAWYEPRPTYGCENGHASRVYLKSETKGKLCLDCGKHIVMLPHLYDTDEKLAAALAQIAQPPAQAQPQKDSNQ